MISEKIIKPAFIGVVGHKKSGKTTLIEKLCTEMASRGVAVGTIKITSHDVEFDSPGKDTFRHRAAGSQVTLIKSKSQAAFFSDSEFINDEIITAIFKKCDYVFIEGNSGSSYPKIYVVDERGMRGDISGPIIAIWGAGNVTSGTPFFNKDQCAKLCEFIISLK